MANRKAVRVLFFPRSSFPETAWCVPLPKANQYRLDNILFGHPAPALGDVIEAREGHDGLVFKRVIKPIGRYTMIIEYPKQTRFQALTRHLRTLGVEAEGLDEGTLYLAVPERLEAREVFRLAQQKQRGLFCVQPRIGPRPPPKVKEPPRPPTLFDAADRGELEAIEGAKPAELKALDERGHSLLFIATREGRTELVNHLLARGASPNPTRRGEAAPLFAAVLRDRPREAKLLLEAGATLELARDPDGDSAVYVAALRESPRILKVLLAAKPAPTDVSHALVAAAGVGNLGICKLLLAAGADPEVKTRRGNSARSIAQKRKRREVLALFQRQARSSSSLELHRPG